MSDIKLRIQCNKCDKDIDKNLTLWDETESIVEPSDFAQTTWHCKCGESYSIGDIDIVNVKDL